MNDTKMPQTDFAVFLNGAWGSGKTFFVNQYLAARYGKSKDCAKDKKFWRVSLNGLSTEESVGLHLLGNLLPHGNSLPAIIGARLSNGLLKRFFDYRDTPERRVLSLEKDGILCLPVLGFDSYRTQWEQAPFHVHDECLEVTLCLRGELEFESEGKTYPFRPGSMFVSGPRDVHRLKSYPKGMSKYWFLFRIPKRGFPLLGLPPDEAASLVHSLTHLPNRLFAGTDDVRRLFKKLFAQYDTLPPGTPDRSLRLRSTVLALLLAVVDAATVPPQARPEVRLRQLVGEMRAHPEQDYPLDRLAGQLGLSSSNLLIRFKRLTGLPPHAFLISQRIARAKEMLAAAIPVTTVAHRLGFASGQHFANHFKSTTGCSPSEWRDVGGAYKKSLK